MDVRQAFGAGDAGFQPMGLRETAISGLTDVAQREADANAATIVAADPTVLLVSDVPHVDEPNRSDSPAAAVIVIV